MNVYVLKLEKNKYYVGKSKCVIDRVIEHKEGKGAAWTKRFKVIDIINELNTYHVNLTVVDPWAEPAEVKHEYHLNTQEELPTNVKFDAVVLAVGHNEFKAIDILSYLNPNHVIFDVKGLLDRNLVDGSL